MFTVFGRCVSFGCACALLVFGLAWTYDGNDKVVWVLEPQKMGHLIGGAPCPHEESVQGDCVRYTGDKHPKCSYNESCTQQGEGDDPASRCYRVEVRATQKCAAAEGETNQDCSPSTTADFCLRKYWGSYSVFLATCQPCVNGDANCSANPVVTTFLNNCTQIP